MSFLAFIEDPWRQDVNHLYFQACAVYKTNRIALALPVHTAYTPELRNNPPKSRQNTRKLYLAPMGKV